MSSDRHESVPEIRVVDIVGLDKQADGGTHVRTTGEAAFAS
jgi:Ser-tRNA(Ala) deacylase AlaX